MKKAALLEVAFLYYTLFFKNVVLQFLFFQA